MVLLLARTRYSLLTAPASPRVLCEEAVRRGCDHLVLTDANGLYGLYPFAREAARVGLQALFGCELEHGGRRLVVIARDAVGYASLCALISDRHDVGVPVDTRFDLPRACERHAAGLWFVCGDPRLLPELVVRVPREQLLVALPRRDVAATAANERPQSRAATGRKLPDPGRRWPRALLLEAAAVLELRAVAVRDVWFATEDDFGLHQLLLAVKWNRALRGGDPAHDLRGILAASPLAHLPRRAALLAGHDDRPDAVAMAVEVRRSCTLGFAAQAPPVFPPLQLPDGQDAMTRLRELVFAGLQRRYGDDAVARARCERELAVIGRMGFPPYFLAVTTITDLARERDIPFVGRGSAADSLVAYCLGLTDADPIRYGLLFERFLNPGRSDLPDIDLDFCWRRRDDLIDAVYSHFGRSHVAMIATYNTCGPRSAYQEVAKAMGLPPTEAARRSKLLPWHGRDDLDLLSAVAETPGFWRRSARASAEPDGDALLPERELLLLRAAQYLLSAPRHLGVHPGGIVITPDEVARYAPLERAHKGVVVTQYDMHFVERLGLVKIDLLGNRALSIVHDCTTMLRDLGVTVPDLTKIAEDDPRTAALLESGRTLACFQVESPAMRTLLRQMAAGTMDRVIQAIALVRPGPASIGMKDAFVRRARGLEPVRTAHPLLAEVFADTFGIMLYQEDVIRAAMAITGVDATAGDGLRRQLGKRLDTDADFDAFVVAGLRRGLPRRAIEQVWAEMTRFAAYSFCKAHSVTYGRLAYRCVWLKSRWPAAFICAMLRNEAGYFAPGVYAEEAKRLGAVLEAPCVNRGQLEYEMLDANVIRVGLSVVRGLSVATADAILTARAAGGPFRSFQDFLERVRPARDETENLILAGACDCFATTRPELLWRLQVATTPGGRRAAQRAAQAGRGALFVDALRPRDVIYPDLPEFDEGRRTEGELRVLGFTLQSHPIDVLWRRGELPQKRSTVPCGALERHVGERVAICGFAVAYRGHRSARDPMCFVTIEDGTGIVEATLFPKVYRRCGGVLQGRGPFVVRGTVEDRLGGVGLSVTDVELAQ